MSTQKSSLEAVKKFNLYAGGGVFLSAMSQFHSVVAREPALAYGETHSTYSEIKPLALSRSDAIRACHMARAQGVNSWLVPVGIPDGVCLASAVPERALGW